MFTAIEAECNMMMFTAIEAECNKAAEAYVSAIRNNASKSDTLAAETTWKHALKKYEAERAFRNECPAK